MGNKASIATVECRRAESDVGKTASCSTLGTADVASDTEDLMLRELVEATSLNEDPSPRIHKGGLSSLVSAIAKLYVFAPSEPSEHQPLPPVPPRIKVRLYHCETDDEHRAFVADILDRVKHLSGKEGLLEAGFEYRKVYCPIHEQTSLRQKDCTEEEKKCDSVDDISVISDSSTEELELDVCDKQAMRTAVMNDLKSASDGNDDSTLPCLQCATRLVHCETNTIITEANRKLYIADGLMYEQVARLAQECAQEEMQRAGNLEWLTVCNDAAHAQPVRALVHKDHYLPCEKEETADNHPTLLVATGKGKVMAGIFSRQHLITTGIEASTALPMVMEARRRNMSVVIFDPNARGDRNGMDSFEKSFEVVLGHLDYNSGTSSESATESALEHAPPKRALYIVAHSASGSQLVRYMLDRVHGYLPYLRAIAFTDSTHNIQWTRKNAALQSLLVSKRCVYFRSASKQHDDLWESRKAGDTVETDSFWQHRFGEIKTLWAGTAEHSLMNWFAHGHIWNHFDEHLQSDTSPNRNESDS